MTEEITDEHLQTLIDQKLSIREMARQTGISRSTLQRRIEKLKGESTPTSTHEGVPFAEELIASWDDLQEMIEWWRERKRATQTPADSERQTERKTYHVEKRHIEAIERASDL